MMSTDKLFYHMALQSIVGIGPVKAKKLLIHFGNAKKVFKANEREYQKVKGLTSAIRDQLKSVDILKRVEKELRFLETNKIRAYCLGESDYPSGLKHCYDAPIVLYSKGNFNLNNRRILSVVGTRNMTPYGSQFLKEFIPQIKAFNPIIVSGLAYGIDICAHHESLENGLCTIGVLAHGLDRVYPKPHVGMARKMLEKGGLFSEFWSGIHPERENFIKRNRIIAGLSEATLVIESAHKGGSLITADLALSYHREVLALPGRYTDKKSQGCNMLIKSNKAAMITSAKDLAFALGWTQSLTEIESTRKNKTAELQKDEKHLYHFLLLSDKVQLDHLALQASFSIQKTISILLKLELKGMVRSYPGKQYQAL